MKVGLDLLEDVVLLDERHLEVDLGELRLPVSSQVLVAEAASDLVVAVEPRDHQQLLEDLRALRQGVETPRIDPADGGRPTQEVRLRLGLEAGSVWEIARGLPEQHRSPRESWNSVHRRHPGAGHRPEEPCFQIPVAGPWGCR